jgi:hypothetical protein
MRTLKHISEYDGQTGDGLREDLVDAYHYWNERQMAAGPSSEASGYAQGRAQQALSTLTLMCGEHNVAEVDKLIRYGVRSSRVETEHEERERTLRTRYNHWSDSEDGGPQCLGHESIDGPIGNVVYCDGSCRR